jgi:hypothetical protein
MDDFEKNCGAYSEELAYSNWMILLQNMSHKGYDVLVTLDFPIYTYFLKSH